MIESLFERLYFGEKRSYTVSRYVATAAEMGIAYKFLTRSLARFDVDGHHFFIHMHVVPLNTAANRAIAKSKYLTHVVLSRRGFPVPAFARANAIGDALEFFYAHKDIVLKPLSGYGGVGLRFLPTNERELTEYFDSISLSRSRKRKRAVLLEEYIRGHSYRVLVLRGEIISVIRRIRPTVTGDGRSTIRQLIAKENSKRKDLPAVSLIRTVDAVYRRLEQQDLNIDSVPAADRTVELLHVSNRHQGGICETVTPFMDDRKKHTVVGAVDEIGLEFAGVDLMTEDISNPDASFYINEINAQPGIKSHYSAVNEVDDVCKNIVEAVVAEFRGHR